MKPSWPSQVSHEVNALAALGAPCLQDLLVRLLPYIQEDDNEIRRRGFESIILGWGLTAALVSLLMVTPVAWALPMLRGFFFPKGLTSLSYLAAPLTASSWHQEGRSQAWCDRFGTLNRRQAMLRLRLSRPVTSSLTS